jgi:ribosomal protein S1
MEVMVKVMEVDKARKRIGLSIKQAQEPSTATKGKPSAAAPRNSPKPAVQNKEKDAPPVSMNDALSALKNKFGK